MKWEIVNRKLAYRGFFQLEVLQLKHRLYDGGWSPVLKRELFRRSNGVAVLPYDPVHDQVLLIEQFRTGAIESQPNPWLIEIVAGLLESSERREEVARREAREETGCELLELQHAMDYFSSPGGFGERVSLYIARADLGDVYGVHGVKEQGEDIRVIRVSAEAAFEMVASNVIVSATPIIALQWLQINHERIRQQWT
jgi:ADP-ribose pyrophosphatase